MIGRVDCVDGACRAERPGLVHRALVGGNIILVLAKTKRVGTDRVRQKRSVDFLTGMACLLETAADVIAVLVHSGTKACIDAADDPGPIVRAGCRSIDRSEEHTSELQSLMRISYADFCLKKKINTTHNYLYRSS